LTGRRLLITQKKRNAENNRSTEAAPPAATAMTCGVVNHALTDEPPPEAFVVEDFGAAGVPGVGGDD